MTGYKICVDTDTQIEREIKFAVGRGFDLPDFRKVVDRSVRQPERTFRTAYFDTYDLRLWGRSITLRYRSGTTDGSGTWTVKLPEADRGMTLDRREVSWPGIENDVPAEAHALLCGLIRRANLDQLVDMETTRRSWTLHDHAGHQLAELDYDDVSVVGGPQDGLRFQQIEIERTDESAADEVIAGVAKALRRAGAAPADQPKLARALGPSAERRDRPVAELRPNSTAADVIRHAIFDGFERLLDHDYRLRLLSDDPHPHDVHQARVATRRMRSHLKTFRRLLDPIWLAHTEDELRWIGTVLGAVRDADVMDGSLTTTGNGDLPPIRSGGLEGLRTTLTAERVKAVAALGEALDSPRYVDLLDRLHVAASNPPLISGSDNNSRKRVRATAVLPKVVRRRWRNIEKKVDAAGRSPSDEQLHQIRIAAKNLRYACELSQPVIGKAARKTAKAAEDIQTVLGEYHDASALIDWLAQAATTRAGRAGFVAGALAAEQDRRRNKLAKRWHRQWAKLSRPSRLRWLM